MMASFRTFRFLAFACFILGINATINPDEPFVLVSCQHGEQAIHIAPLLDTPGTLQFTSIPIERSNDRLGVSYDPVDQKVYYAIKNDGAYSTEIDMDGSNDIPILISNFVEDVEVDPDARKVYYINIMGLNWSYLNGTGLDNIPLPTGSSIGPRKLAKIGSRILVTGSDYGIISLDTNENVLTDEIYSDVDAQAADIDPAAGHLYWLESTKHPIVIHRQDIADYNSTCIQNVLNTTDIHGGNIPANNYEVMDMALYKDYAYVVGKGTDSQQANYSGLLRINLRTGVLEDVGDKSKHGGSCVGLHIHDPAKLEAGRGYAGGLGAPGLSGGANVIPVDIVEKWFGGLIADLVIPITGPMVDWHLELSFPRQVFKLEIQGCSAEISKETTIQYGRRKGTDFVISPSPENRSPPPGEDLQITVVAETWKDVRGMKRGISAMFVPVTDLIVCPPTPTIPAPPMPTPEP